ncbi:hypothetical protein C8A03DRAFT_40746 [Achaetomium macrosporum]|uniref:Uncharacterized protein n=1 Tax=Achaetomium macrosporum TaxID=79813 RepID=A0AAN7CJE1_9PEZI|nr:hypothetical protein C8A03DRAFT_40746 [Achaetomium macrosporum]
MEPRTSDCPQDETRTRSFGDDDTHLAASEHRLATSLPILRFPRPQGSRHLANWVSSSSPDIMQPSNMSDASSLSESSYEIIHSTDTESQDDRLTESVGSLSVPQPDDVQSLDGSETPSHAESDEELDHSSYVPSITYADHALSNPSTQLPPTSLEYGSSTEGSGVVVSSIELQEGDADDDPLSGKISAKHAVREFSEEESAVIAQDLDLLSTPKRLVASIRQTMSHSYLSTQEPLRVLYVGRADAQRSIVLKICSAIWASPKNPFNGQDHFGRYHEGVYNIVPISSFGPTPELDLIETSAYQIKVEHCTSAEQVAGQEGFLDDAVYSVTVEHERSYTSFLPASGSVIHPKWDLPHVAIFFCSDSDDAEAERTRHAAWCFMNRHGIPSVFIAEQQMFCKRWDQYIDEHVIHLFLESRNPERPLPPQRFPIDYASFSDIDARQMNRHLAYLTGLTEDEETSFDQDASGTESMLEAGLQVQKGLDKAKQVLHELVECSDVKRWIWALLIPVLVSMAAPFLIPIFSGWLRSGGPSQLQPSPSGVCVSPPTYKETLATRSSSVATSTTTVVINVTSTKTVQVSQTKPSTSALASALSFAGLLSDKPSATPAESETRRPADSTKRTVCSVRVYSPTEFLVAIPSRNKAVWLADGAIDIDVRRSDEQIRTKISSVDEGVLVELVPKDAFGVLNVSVITTRRPRINETFQVDFGRKALAEAFDAGMQLLQGIVKKMSVEVERASHLVDDARKFRGEVFSAMEHASEAVRSRTAGTVKRTTDNVCEHMARQLESAETIRKEVDYSILRAQIASRLWWLKLQGKSEEYAEYARNASRFLNVKHDELLKNRCDRKGQEKSSPKEVKSFFGLRIGMYSPCRKNCARRDGRGMDVNSRDRGWEPRWKKLMGGV